METRLLERLGLPVTVDWELPGSDELEGPEWSSVESSLRRAHLSWLLPGVPDHALDLLVSVSDGLADSDEAAPSPRGEQVLVDAAEATVQLGRVLEAAQLDLLGAMASAAGRRLLESEHGEVDPGALSRTRRERWRARTKSVVSNEFQALSGYGIQDCHDRVGFALAPRAATMPADAALRRGDADWWQVWQWWKRCRNLDPGRAADVSELVFGPPAPPGEVVDPGRRPSRREFMNLLDREATRVEGTDEVAERERRHGAVEARRADATVDADGTGCLRVIGRTSAVVAAMDRVDTIARKARASGDSRSLDQLRSDTTLALLMGGVLPDVDASGGSDSLDVARGGGWTPVADDRLSAVLAGHPSAVVEVVVPYDVLAGADRDGVALLTGHGCVTGEHAREIALAPGTTFYRLVTDPASGMLVDRSAQGYVPDDAMRSIIHAADRYCRGPGCTIPAANCDVDHVLEHPAGPTSVGNLSSAHSRHHGMKTNKWWSCVMDPDSRRVSWTTFFGRIYPTMPFDYSLLSSSGESRSDGRPTVVERPSLADRQDQLVYAALADRQPGSTLGADDDEPATWRSGWTACPEVRLTHQPPGGEVRPGAPPTQRLPEDLLSEWGSRDEPGDPPGPGPRPEPEPEPPPPF